MKKLFAAFWKRNLAFFKLAIVTNLEYRLNFFVDALAQPILHAGIESFLWFAVFTSIESNHINGFTREYYLSYAIWGGFMARIASSWMYEFRMIDEIDSGSINGLLVRPMTFYEYYLSQLMGYKFITTIFSFIAPIAAILIFNLPTHLIRLPLAMALVFYFLILIHSIGFLVACSSFFLNKVHSFSAAKNLCIWLLTGELVPIDLMPETMKNIFLSLPFSSGVFIPVGYITGRIDESYIWHGFKIVTISIILTSFLAYFFWKRGLKSYSGTGA